MKQCKLTKWCPRAWDFIQIHAGGMMQCCAVGPDTDEGDFILDYCEKKARGENVDPFNNEGLVAIRKGLLTGNLRPMCRECFYVHNELITTEEMERRIKELLKKRNPGIDMEKADLTRLHSYDTVAISFTNRCNLSCIYCVQSVHKHTNPYFKMEFPYEYAVDALELLAAQKPRVFATCVEGEATLYSKWYELFSQFHTKHPKIKLRMTTNLNREYSDQELELLANYYLLDISIDSLDPEVFSRLRCGGKLELLLKNVDLIQMKARELGITDRRMTFHVVLTDQSYEGIEELADYAFERGIGIVFGDYEERGNTLAVSNGLLKPISQLPLQIQQEIRDAMQRVKMKAARLGLPVFFQGTIFSKIDADVEKSYNMFKPYDDDPVINAFYSEYPTGLPEAYLHIVYDVDNVSHEGIMLGKGYTLHLSGLNAVKSVVVREIHVYKKGTISTRYEQTIMLRYRKRIMVENGLFSYSPEYPNDNVEKVLLEICDYELQAGES